MGRQPLKLMNDSWLKGRASNNAYTRNVNMNKELPDGKENFGTTTLVQGMASLAKRSNGLVSKPTLTVEIGKERLDTSDANNKSIDWFSPDDAFVPPSKWNGVPSLAASHSDGGYVKMLASTGGESLSVTENSARGRGRGRTLPAWMTKTQQQEFMRNTAIVATVSATSKTSRRVEAGNDILPLGSPTVSSTTKMLVTNLSTNDTRGRGRGRTLPAWMSRMQKESMLAGTARNPATNIAPKTKAASIAGSKKRKIENLEDVVEPRSSKVSKKSETTRCAKSSDVLVKGTTTSLARKNDLTHASAGTDTPGSSPKVPTDTGIILDLSAVGNCSGISSGTLCITIRLCTICQQWKPKPAYAPVEWKQNEKVPGQPNMQWKGRVKKRTCNTCFTKRSSVEIEKIMATHKERKEQPPKKIVASKALVLVENKPSKMKQLPTIETDASPLMNNEGKKEDTENRKPVSAKGGSKTTNEPPREIVLHKPEKPPKNMPFGWNTLRSPPTLPEGWNKFYEPKCGQYYYHNPTDGTVRWDRPDLGGNKFVSGNSALPWGWTVHVHPILREYCFHDAGFNLWTWDGPVPTRKRGYYIY